MVKNWLITGGCGFIGSSLIKKIISCNANLNLRVLDNLSVGSKQDLAEVCDYQEVFADDIDSPPSGVELVVGDIKDSNVCNLVASGVDVIVHLAANTGVAPSVENPMFDCLTNVIGTVNLLEAARVNGVSKFIFASSGAPVGEVDPPIHENLAANPVSPYGASKLSGEGYCSAYFRSFGLNTVSLRFGNVYGPRSRKKASVVAKFIRLAMAGETLEIYGDGEQTRDFVYIDDLLEAIVKGVNASEVGGEIFQIATNTETTINELLDKLVPILKKTGIDDFKLIKGESRQGDVLRNFSDTTKASNMLGWKSRVSLAEGLERVVKYFLHDGLKSDFEK